MKKSLLLFFYLATLFSCTKPPTDAEPRFEGEMKTNTLITADEALSELDNVLDLFDVKTRGGNKRQVAETIVVGGFGETRSDVAEEEPLLYVFNFENDEGFAIMSGDTRTESIFALADKGNYNPSEPIENPGFGIFLANLDIYYRISVGLPVEDENGDMVIVANGITKPDPLNPDYDITWTYGPWEISERKGSVIPCQWGQGYPYNQFCWAGGENALTGCVATAVAQIMYHWSHSVTYSGRYYDWDLMRLHTNNWTASPASATTLIARLFERLCDGNNLNSDFGVASTGANKNNVPRTFTNFGFSSGGGFQGFNDNAIYNIVVSRPILVRGNAIKNGSTYQEGHMWVVDEAVQQRRSVNYYYDGVYKNTSYETKTYLHCNWGWDSYRDGYYLSGVFNSNYGGATLPTRSDSSGTSGYFQYNVELKTEL